MLVHLIKEALIEFGIFAGGVVKAAPTVAVSASTIQKNESGIERDRAGTIRDEVEVQIADFRLAELKSPLVIPTSEDIFNSNRVRLEHNAKMALQYELYEIVRKNSMIILAVMYLGSVLIGHLLHASFDLAIICVCALMVYSLMKMFADYCWDGSRRFGD